LRPPIESVHRALVLLKELREGAALSVTAAADLLDVAPSSAHRMLNALCYDGFAVQDRDRHYRLGPAFIPEMDAAMSIEEFRELVHPVIAELSREVGETVHVWARSGPLLRYVHGVEGDKPAHVPVDEWDRVPAYASAAGKALLSELNNRQLEEVFASGLPPARASKITSLNGLKRHLAAVRQRGYAISLEEAAQGVGGVAVCAKDPLGRPVFAISLAIPSSRFDRDAVLGYIALLRAAVERTEEALAAQRG